MVYSQTWGTGKQAAILLHCSLASSDAWHRVAGRLAGDLNMTGLDFPGHGKTEDWDGAGDYHTVCRDAASGFLVQPAHLIGHSFGATIALRLAVERPDMVRSLTLIEPVFFAAAKGTDAYAQHMKEFQPFVDAMARGADIDAAKAFNQVWGSGADWEAMPGKLRGYIAERINLVPASVPALYDDNAGMARKGRLEAVRCPVLLIEGTTSPSIVAAINDALAARLPDVQRVRVKGASHMVPITHSAQVAAAIGDFL